ncbi:MAG: hypothetical protein ABIU11_01600 [Chitinophagaceae bacterium]
MKKLNILIIFATIVTTSFAQDSKNKRDSKSQKKNERREKVNSMIKQAEEGVLIYSKQSIFGIQARTNGYGAFYELGRMKTNKKTNLYRIDFTEIKSQKEVKLSSGNGPFFGNPFVYGKINNFYQLTLSFGQQLILGQKGNKNGVAVSAIYNGGLALGLLRPYYLEVDDQSAGENRVIKYTVADSALFVSPSIIGSGGLGKGWGEIKIKPGVFAKTALRFDYGRYNEIVSAIELGLSAEFYSSKIPILLGQKDKQFFVQGYVAILFGRRR